MPVLVPAGLMLVLVPAGLSVSPLFVVAPVLLLFCRLIVFLILRLILQGHGVADGFFLFQDWDEVWMKRFVKSRKPGKWRERIVWDLRNERKLKKILFHIFLI